MLCSSLALVILPSCLAGQPLTLEQIMADPDWIGRAPMGPYWAADGRSIYYSQKQEGVEETDLIEIDTSGRRLRVVADEALSTAGNRSRERSRDGELEVYARFGDLYVRHLDEGTLQQLTRTAAEERSPFFLVGDTRIAFERDDAIFVRDLESGLESQPFDLRFEDEPEDGDDENERRDYLDAQQERLFSFLQEQKEDRERDRQRQKEKQSKDPGRADPTWYLGDELELVAAVLSPTTDWLAIVVSETSHEEGRRDTLPHFVSKDGYVENQNVRAKVGTQPAAHQLLLLDRTQRRQLEPDLAVLPTIEIDPLAALRAAQTLREQQEDQEGKHVEKEEEEDEEESKGPRPVRIPDLRWSPDGKELLLQIFSLDNKDRWIATVDFEEGVLRPVEHFHDPGWINRAFSTVGWLPDSEHFYFVSEESGYSQIYLQSARGSERRALTSGRFVVSPRGSTPLPHLTRAGDRILFTANREHPGIINVYAVDIASATVEQLTELEGITSFVLSPDESQLLLRHSTRARPPDLWVQEARPGALPQRLTDTVSEAFRAIDWTVPQIVEIPSSKVDRPVYSRLYRPKARTNGAAVVFIHGAGYLQNAHYGWSSYFREFMFHSLLTERGYTVLDMDYRASAGYGRDWRTAIYRRMGTPEVEDLEDGVDWLVANHGIDRSRIGTYGGSYGGFLTLMSLFTRPDLFASGAALRPVTDWAHYNHDYTSNILNTPELDPEAFERSSPIEFAEGLTKPLLLCHGVLDDNVLFQDTARLVQRLIELEKRDWDVAIFPVERHGFRRPSSWLDEYRRILELYEETLN